MDFLLKTDRFSFCLGDRKMQTLAFTRSIRQDGDTVTTTYTFENGLRVENYAKKYEDFGAYEWVNVFTNTSGKQTEPIHTLWDADIVLPLPYEENRKWEACFPDAKTATKIYAPTGSTWSKDEFYCDVDRLENNRRIHHIYPGETKAYHASGGRSSETFAPFFNVEKDGKGYLLAVGWTGQWSCRFARENDALRFCSGIENVSFCMLPGESFRTSSVVVMSYEGDFIEAQNKWRRLIKKHFSLIGQNGRDTQGPLCAGVWGGMQTSEVLSRIETIQKNKLPFEYIWMDAGWYGETTMPTPDEFEGDWGKHTGDWQVSPHIHPSGLRDVSKAIHDAGMKFILWFEPERVIRSTPIVKAHPEYFLSDHNEENHNLLLNLGDEAAWEYCFQTLSALIEELQIDCYRQDFNFSPLAFWRKNDAPDRQGITEIKHINGLYRLWDALLKRFPHLLIDNCAAGGRRIDVETLRRSMPLWRSDYQCPANYDVEASQCHHQTFHTWMPYSGSGTGRIYDAYRVRSAYDASMTTNYTFSARESFGDDPEKIAFIRKYMEEYLQIRPYFSEDFYPLTAVSFSTDTWSAFQFDRPSEKDGILQVFRREDAPYETATFFLRGMDTSCCYRFTDFDGGSFTVTGNELLQNGLRITMPQKRTAKIYKYEVI